MCFKKLHQMSTMNGSDGDCSLSFILPKQGMQLQRAAVMGFRFSLRIINYIWAKTRPVCVQAGMIDSSLQPQVQ